MSRAAVVVAPAARAVAAVALALSWLLIAGTPASALITNATVESPRAGAVLKKQAPLVVAVDRTGAGEEKVSVRTRLFYGGTPTPPDPEETPTESSGEAEGDASAQQQPAQPLKPVSDKVVNLQFIDATEPGATQRLRFGVAVDPYRLVWLKNPGVAPNGQYTVEFRAVGSDTPPREWQRHEFRLDARPPATSAPGIAAADPAAKRLSIAWQAHPVPDLSHYTVERKRDRGDWKVAVAKVDPKRTQIEDTVPAYGSYRYRVIAVRPAGDGSDETRSAVSPASATFDLQRSTDPAPGGSTGSSDGGTTGDSGTGTGSSGLSGSSTSGTSAPPPLPSSSGSNPSLSSQSSSSGAPDVAPPPGFEDTFRGPLDYDVEQREVTERVPVDVAQGGVDSDSTIKVLDRAIDQSRVLPPVAGGLILVVSAAHVLRYLNE